MSPALIAQRARAVLPACYLTLALAACGERAEQAPASPKGQVVAQIGKEDVTVSELDNEYRVLGITPDKITPDVTRRVIRELITRRYLAQRAVAAGLDRDPTVLLTIRRAQLQILAQQLVSRDVQAKVSALGRSDIDRYMNEHPASFAKRVKLTTEQINIPLTPETVKFVQDNKEASSLSDVERRLAAAGIRIVRSTGAIFSGDVPDALFNQLLGHKGTDVFFLTSGETGSFVQVKSSEPAPLEGEEAARRARQMMGSEITQAEISSNTGAVNSEIKYFDQYVDLMKDDKVGEPSPTPSPAAPAK